MNSDLSSFLEALQGSVDTETAWSGLLRYCEGLDLAYVHCTLGLEVSNVEFQTTCPESWMTHYQEQDWQDADMLYEHFMEGQGILAYGIDKQGRNPDVRDGFVNLLNEARYNLGSGTGIAFPALLPSGKRVGGVNIAIRGGLEELNKMEPGSMLDLSIAANATYMKMFLMRRFGMEKARLTLRERDCLQYLAQGLRTKEISDKLNLADVTVTFHLDNVKRKMGAQTRDQALARAMVLGLIEP